MDVCRDFVDVGDGVGVGVGVGVRCPLSVFRFNDRHSMPRRRFFFFFFPSKSHGVTGAEKNIKKET